MLDLRNIREGAALADWISRGGALIFICYSDYQKFSIPAEVRNRINMITGTMYLIITL